MRDPYICYVGYFVASTAARPSTSIRTSKGSTAARSKTASAAARSKTASDAARSSSTNQEFYDDDDDDDNAPQITGKNGEYKIFFDNGDLVFELEKCLESNTNVALEIEDDSDSSGHGISYQRWSVQKKGLGGRFELQSVEDSSVKSLHLMGKDRNVYNLLLVYQDKEDPEETAKDMKVGYRIVVPREGKGARLGTVMEPINNDGKLTVVFEDKPNQTYSLDPSTTKFFWKRGIGCWPYNVHCIELSNIIGLSDVDTVMTKETAPKAFDGSPWAVNSNKTKIYVFKETYQNINPEGEDIVEGDILVDRDGKRFITLKAEARKMLKSQTMYVMRNAYSSSGVPIDSIECGNGVTNVGDSVLSFDTQQEDDDE